MDIDINEKTDKINVHTTTSLLHIIDHFKLPFKDKCSSSMLLGISGIIDNEMIILELRICTTRQNDP